jgi:hypothetical protein
VNHVIKDGAGEGWTSRHSANGRLVLTTVLLVAS